MICWGFRFKTNPRRPLAVSHWGSVSIWLTRHRRSELLTRLADTSLPSSTSPTPPAQQQPTPFKPNYDILSSLSSSRPSSQPTTPAPSVSQPQQTPTPPPADPFASLVSASSRVSSPLAPPAQSGQRQGQASSSLLDLGGGGPSTQPQSQQATEANNDEEWTFASALPENSLPSTNKVQVLNSSLRIDFVARRNPANARQIHVVALFSNSTSQPLSELHFQVAVEKVGSAVFHFYYFHFSSENVQGLTDTGLHAAAAAAVGAGYRAAAAERGAAGDAAGRDRRRQGELGAHALQGVVQGRGGGEGGAGDGAAVGDFVRPLSYKPVHHNVNWRMSTFLCSPYFG